MSHRCHSILLGKNGRPLAEIASASSDLPHGHVIPEHFHPEDQLLFASKGVVMLRIRQGVWVVPPLRAVWIPADTTHSVSMSGQVSMRLFISCTDSPCLHVCEIKQEDDQVRLQKAQQLEIVRERRKHGTLKTYPGFPHGMPTTNADQINVDLLAFFKGAATAASV